MKKFTFAGSVFTLFFVTGFLIIGCKKESSTTFDKVETADETNIRSQAAGAGGFAGSVDANYAASLRNNYLSESLSKDQPLYIAFSAKDLTAFIGNLRSKYKSDSIYVNFGVYGNGAIAPATKDNGRLTIYFTGNKIGKSITGKTTNAVDGEPSDFLNHGQMTP